MLMTEKQLKAATKGMPYEERLAFEKAEKRKRYAVLLVTAREIAAFLGNDWTARECDHEYEPSSLNLCCVDGRGIYLSISHYGFEGRVNITGIYDFGPREYGLGMPYKMPRPDISVSLARGSKVIAAEIGRRFMAEYIAIWKTLQQQVTDTRTYRTTQVAIASRLAESIGVKLKNPDASHDYARFSTYYSERSEFVEVSVSNGTVDLKASGLTEAQALAILKIITKGKDDGKND